jgi:hypothetical protein
MEIRLFASSLTLEITKFMNQKLNIDRKSLLNIAAIMVGLMVSALAANATPVNVPNASFESPSSPTSTSTNFNIASGWVFNVKDGSQFGTGSIASKYSSVGTSSGNDYATINNDFPGVTDTITSAASLGAITPLTTYTLTIAVGNETQSDTSLYGAPGNLSFSLLANGVAFATKTVPNGSVANGTFADFTLTYTTPSSSSIIGENLEIQLATLPETGTAYQPGFDNIRLDANVTSVPEPSTWALMVCGALMLCCLIRRHRIV